MSTTKQPKQATGIKETITSLTIALMLAFLFRGFVIEGFVIPTGSMAPTLRGKHIQFTSANNGYRWAVGPWNTQNFSGVEVNDPMSGERISSSEMKLSSGDRVFVLKYLPILHSPERWDVVVFKNPGSNENFIKRMIGKPGEQVALVDGDVFVRPFVQGETARAGWDAWTDESWTIARKPERVQRTMFLPVYNSRYAPIDPKPSFRAPMRGSTSGWEGLQTSTYTYQGGDTTLEWDSTVRPITDRYPYNQLSKRFDLFAPSTLPLGSNQPRPFPVSDIAMSVNISPDDAGVVLTPTIEARGMVFRAVVDTAAATASVQMKSDQDEATAWVTMDSGETGAIAAGTFTKVEFWHVDQALYVYIDGALVCGGAEKGAYTLTPSQRAEAATAMSYEQLKNDASVGNGVTRQGVFSRPEIYVPPRVRWGFSGGGFTLTNVSIERDISYQVALPELASAKPTRGAHPNFFPTLTGDQFFMCGDNSPRSEDGRLWSEDQIVPWVREHIDPTPGVVNRDLVVGKAFVVYFPSLLREGPIPAPDIGRVRWIW
jgi:signal peptidase I